MESEFSTHNNLAKENDESKSETLSKLIQHIVTQSQKPPAAEQDPFTKLETSLLNHNYNPTLIAKGRENAKCWKAGKLTEIMKRINETGPSVSRKVRKPQSQFLETVSNLPMPPPISVPSRPTTVFTEPKPKPLKRNKTNDTVEIPDVKSAAPEIITITSPNCPERKRFKFHKNAPSSQSQPENPPAPEVQIMQQNLPKISLFKNPSSVSTHETTTNPICKSPTSETKTVSTSNGLGWFNSSANRPSLFAELPPSEDEQLRRNINFPTKPSTSAKVESNATPIQDKPDVITVPDEEEVKPGEFRSAYEQLLINDKAKGIRRIGLSRPPPKPMENICKKVSQPQKSNSNENENGAPENPELAELMADDRMKNIDVKMAEAVLNEVVEVGASTDWNDIAGLDGVKRIIREIIIWPMMRPDIFTGLRGPPKGILLFGPPGTGKTMIGRLIATQSKSTFFNISASSLTSKWIGDGEKMVRALFQVARVKQPAVIFIDEIDSILTQRSDTEHESSRRLKTEFLIQFDGCGTKSEDRILVIGVTNRPQELDEAARRRLVKRIYIPLPDPDGRKQLVKNLLADQNISLNEADFGTIAEITEGYSGADMASLCQEASYGPIRDIGTDIQNIDANKVRPMLLHDFERALKQVKASVASSDLTIYENWDKQFGVTLS